MHKEWRFRDSVRAKHMAQKEEEIAWVLIILYGSYIPLPLSIPTDRKQRQWWARDLWLRGTLRSFCHMDSNLYLAQFPHSCHTCPQLIPCTISTFYQTFKCNIVVKTYINAFSINFIVEIIYSGLFVIQKKGIRGNLTLQ